MFNSIDFRRVFTATAGAAILSTACVLGAVAPAKAADLSTADWQQSVNREIDRTMEMPSLRRPLDGRSVATLAVRFDDKGGYQGASIVKSSGDRAIDGAALRTARAVRYPVLPATAPRSVTMQLVYAEPGAEQPRHAPAAKPAPVQLASR